MEPGGILQGGQIAAALFGKHMNQHRLPQLPGRAKQRQDTGKIVTIRRPQIGQPHVFKQRFREEHPLEPVFYLAGKPINRVAAGELFQNGAIPTLGMEVVLAGTHPGQVPGQAAVAPADGHLVVIENHHHRLPADRQIVQRLVDHAAGSSAVSHQGDHVIVLTQQRPCPGHAQGNGD